MTWAERLAAWRAQAEGATRGLFRRSARAEGRPPPSWRPRFDQVARMAGGFSLVLILAFIGFASMSEIRSRFEWPPSVSAATVEEGRSMGLAVAAQLFSDAHRASDATPWREMFAPAELRRRRTAAWGAATAAARAFLQRLRPTRGARNPLLLQALGFSVIGPDYADSRAAEAVNRLNAAVARGEVLLAMRPQDVKTLAREAARALAARIDALGELARARRPSAATQAASAFSGARGDAYAWASLLRAAAHDAGPAFDRRDPSFTRALSALDRAAAQNPAFFAWGAQAGWPGPNHLAVIGLDLAVAAEELRTFAEE